MSLSGKVTFKSDGKEKIPKKRVKKIPQRQCLVEWMAGVKGERGLSHWNHWKIYKFFLDFLGIFSGDGNTSQRSLKTLKVQCFCGFQDGWYFLITVFLGHHSFQNDFPDVFPLLNIQSGKCLNFGKFKITKSRHYIFKLSTALDSIWGL